MSPLICGIKVNNSTTLILRRTIRGANDQFCRIGVVFTVRPSLESLHWDCFGHAGDNRWGPARYVGHSFFFQLPEVVFNNFFPLSADKVWDLAGDSGDTRVEARTSITERRTD